MQAMVWVAGGLALAGAAMFYLEYAQSRRARNEVITEVNFAGQRVEGTRADLYHLHHAQEQIMNLSSVFKQASLETTSDTIHHIMESVKERAARVRVLETGRYNAGTEKYEFSEPAIKLVKDGPHIRHDTGPAPLAGLSARPAFNSAQEQAEDVARHIIALENALPPEVLEKVAAARAAQMQQLPKAP